ncbi:hypothetical protein ACFQZ4_36160 [Catellatospora coxensis]
MRRLIRPALSGLLAAAGGIATAELVASPVRPESSPLVAIGGTVIDATPTPVKEYAVATFGTYDKPLLIGTILAVLALLAAAVGVLAVHHRAAALLAIGALGLVGAAAALTRPMARPIDALPALLAGAVSAGLLAWLAPKAATAPRPHPRCREPVPPPTAHLRANRRRSPPQRQVTRVATTERPHEPAGAHSWSPQAWSRSAPRSRADSPRSSGAAAPRPPMRPARRSPCPHPPTPGRRRSRRPASTRPTRTSTVSTSR